MELFSLQDRQYMLLTLPILVMALSFHEYAHAYTADKLGDPTPKKQGRLTTNPLKHINLFGFLSFLLLGFGWARPVRTDSTYFEKPRRDLALVAVSGPLTNLFLAALFAVAIFIFFRMINPMLLQTSIAAFLAGEFLWSGFYLNLVFFFLNMLPTPPLDGSRLLYSLLPKGSDGAIIILERYGIFVLLFLIVSGTLGKILGPVVNSIVVKYANLLVVLL